jgi:fatty acid desaturase
MNMAEEISPKEAKSELRLLGNHLKTSWLSLPTFCLLGVGTCLFVGSLFCLKNNPTSPVPVFMNIVLIYLLFTPMHEASHGSFSGNTFFNAILGHWSALFLLAPYSAFRWVHLEHHKFTNIPGKDPDFWSGSTKFKILLPFKWATQDLHYYWCLCNKIINVKSGIKKEKIASEQSRLLKVFWGSFATMGVLGLMMAGFWYFDLWMVFVWGWFVPSRVAMMILSFLFDYLPHRPYIYTIASNKYKATKIFPNPFLRVMLVGQDLHLIHHLYPSVPFYRYPSVYRLLMEKIDAFR